MTHRFAGTMQKVNKQKVTGMVKHNTRQYENNSNESIDPSRTHLNKEFIPQKNTAEILKHIEENKKSEKATRKDAVLVNEWIISGMAMQDEDGDYILDDAGEKQYYLQKLDEEKQDRYFMLCAVYFMKKFGKENITNATVHNDEMNPHMHIGIIPLKDGKLSSKEVFNRQTLREVQQELPDFLQKNGFDIERGMEGNKRRKFSDKEYKELQDEKKVLQEGLKKEKEKQDQLKAELASREEIIKRMSLITDAKVDELIDKAMQKRITPINAHNIKADALKSVGLIQNKELRKNQNQVQNKKTYTKTKGNDYSPHY